MVAGGAYAGIRAGRRYKSRSRPAAPIAAETAGGMVGGWLGGALPDWIDPPTSPNHRNFGHGVATVAGAIAWTADMALAIQQRLRSEADKLLNERWQLQSDVARALSIAAEFFLRFLAGLIDGLIAGYASHLALDFCTPSGLPLFVRGY